MTFFIGVDGEGITIDDTGEHRYVMIASSLGNSVVNPNGVSTQDCFRFLFETKSAGGDGSALVGFAFNYDINMILRDVAKPHLAQLWLEGVTIWRRFRLQWLPSKWFTVTDLSIGRSVTVFDTFGFYQCSFAKALAGWRVPAPPMLDHMKASRSQFTASKISEMLEYCHAECEALATLMDQLKASLDSVNLPVTKWHGAGSIANSLLGREGVHEHIQPDETYGDLVPGIMGAYFGGRTELFQQGEFSELFGYDLRSAYPAACLTLPSLIGARFIRDKRCRPKWNEISLHHVKWKVPTDSYIMPFPFRYRRRIFYPAEGEGFYWSCEVAAAKAIHGRNIQILDSWKLDGPNLGDRPLSWVEPIYKERARLKREGHFGHQSYKLAINALYGKLAQGVGYKGRDPRFRTYVWAGWITAYTRARMASLATPDVVAIATDGIYFTSDPGHTCGPNLGELEPSYMSDAFVAQPGIYTGTSSDGVVKKARGVYTGDVDYDDLRIGYREEGPYFVYERDSTRFVGLGTVMTLRRFDTWRRWVTAPRQVSLYPARKLVVNDAARPTRHAAPRIVCSDRSEPYSPKRSGIDAPGMVDYIQALEQPMRA